MNKMFLFSSLDFCFPQTFQGSHETIVWFIEIVQWDKKIRI